MLRMRTMHGDALRNAAARILAHGGNKELELLL